MDQLAGATQMDAIEPDRPSAVEASPETALGTELPSNETHESDDLTPIASIEPIRPAASMASTWCSIAAAAPVAETAAPQAEMQVEPASEAAVMAIAPSASLEPAAAIAPERRRQRPAATTASPDVPPKRR